MNMRSMTASALLLFLVLLAPSARAQDTDLDGMPDSWEVLYGLNPGDNSDAVTDLDSDLLSNLGEYLHTTIPTNPDTDGDTLRDGWEVLYGFDPLSPAGGLPDVDIQFVGRYDTVGFAADVQVVSNLAYVADGTNGLVILDVSSAAAPTFQGGVDTPNFARRVSASTNLAYLADDTNGLRVADVSNPLSPTLIGAHDTASLALDVFVVSNLAYVADQTEGLLIVDVSVATNPVRLGRYDSPGSASGVFVVSNVAYLADGLSDFRLVDVSVPTNPTLLAVATTPGFAAAVTVVSNRAYVADSDAGLQVFDVSTPTNPVPFGSLSITGSVVDVAIQSGFAYLADRATGLRVLSITNPADPRLVGTYHSAGESKGVAVVTNTVYLADGTNGLVVLENRGALDIDGDGLSDVWEMANFATLTNMPAGDNDGDGISNWGEFLTGLNPTSANTDGDAQSDGTEMTWGSDPRTAGSFLATASGTIFYSGAMTGSVRVVVSATNIPSRTIVLAAPGGYAFTTLPSGWDYTFSAFRDFNGNGKAESWEAQGGYSGNPVHLAGNTGGIDITLVETDTDGDGLADFIETTVYGTDPNDADSDDDGYNDGAEILSGTNPLNPLSFPTTVSGTISYSGVQTGVVRITATLTNTASRQVTVAAPGAYTVTNIPTLVNVSIAAYRDVNGNVSQESWEPQGSYTGNPFSVTGPRSGVNVTLRETRLTGVASYSGGQTGLIWVLLTSTSGTFVVTLPAPGTFLFTNNLSIPAFFSLTAFRDMNGNGTAESWEAQGANTNNPFYLTNAASVANVALYDTDTDGDGMPGWWEVFYGFDPNNPADAAQNADGDALTNLEEYQNDTDPTDSDTDDDGYSDSREVNDFGSMPADPADPIVVDDDGAGDPYPGDPEVSDPDEDGTLAHPFDAIQKGLNVAFEGNTILVLDGTYNGEGNRDIELGLGGTKIVEGGGGGPGGSNLIVVAGVGSNALLAALLGTNTLPPGVSDLVVASNTSPSSAVGIYSNFPTMPSDSSAQPLDGIILSTGEIADAPGTNRASGTTTDLGIPGSADMTTLVGYETHDAVSIFLTFTTDETVKQLSFNLLFGSEEFPEFVPSQFNDAFAAFLDGKNISFDKNGQPLTVNNNFFQLDNDPYHPSDPDALSKTPVVVRIEYDGLTPLLVTEAPLTPGKHTLKLIVADSGDSVLDSAIFLSNLKFSLEGGGGRRQGIVLRSENGLDSTFINADTYHGGIFVSASATTNTRIQGFSIRSWKDNGGDKGIVCNSGASPIIQDCRIWDCGLAGISCEGTASPILRNLLIHGNDGPGIRCGSGAVIIQTNLVATNTSVGIECNGTGGLIEGSEVAYNMGGGITASNGASIRMTRLKVHHNTEGSGIRLDDRTSPFLANCLINDNVAAGNGAGLYIGTNCFPTGFSCTISANASLSGVGGGLWWNGSPKLRNMIIWGNSAVQHNDNATNPAADIQYCILGQFFPGFSNRVVDPVLAGNFRLTAGSPAIDTGTPAGTPSNDLDGVSRPLDGDNNGDARFDLGCYEYLNILADSDHDGMPDVWENAYFGDPLIGDPDGDDDLDYFINLHECLASTIPTDNSSLLLMGLPRVGTVPTGAVRIVTWQSVATKSYKLQRTTNVLAGYSNIATNIPATAPMNVYTDTTAVGFVPYLYRTQLE